MALEEDARRAASDGELLYLRPIAKHRLEPYFVHVVMIHSNEQWHARGPLAAIN